VPSSHRALRVTDTYRRRVALLRQQAQHTATRNWSVVDGADLNGTHRLWVARTAPRLVEVQRAAARLSVAYLTAFVAVELGRRVTPPRTPPANAIGVSRAGKPIAAALDDSLVPVKVAIKDGKTVGAALALGLTAIARNASEDVAFTARDTVSAGITADDRIVGWQRVTNGGCGACLALADGDVMPDDTELEIHDNCQCTAEPVVADTPNDVQRPTGSDQFAAMTQAQQDQSLGPDAAQLVRDGQVPLRDLVERSPMDAIADQITQSPLEALHHH
jgi:hypothetical protein